MNFKFLLKQMPMEEKLAAMESLWEDLCQSAHASEPPAWIRGKPDKHGFGQSKKYCRQVPNPESSAYNRG